MIKDPFEPPQGQGLAPSQVGVVPYKAPLLRPAHIILEEFLVLEEIQALMRFTLKNEPKFKSTTVLHDRGTSVVDTEYRRSSAVFDLGPYYELFARRLLTFLPYIFERLGEVPFVVSRIEAQIVASGDGDFYRPHADNAHDKMRSRAITYVFYYYHPPKAFTGGELRIWDAQGNTRTILPTQNQMVLFPSGFPHEIMPVRCPSRRFRDSRFALNGWIHR